MLLAVDIDGDGLAGAGGAPEDRALRAVALEGRAGEEGEFTDLGVAMVDLVGHAGELEDLAGAKERLVVAKGGSLPHR